MIIKYSKAEALNAAIDSAKNELQRCARARSKDTKAFLAGEISQCEYDSLTNRVYSYENLLAQQIHVFQETLSVIESAEERQRIADETLLNSI